MLLSDAAHEKLRNELHDLTHVKLPEVLALVNDSRSAGDIGQNPDYFVAAEAESQVRSRIARIEAALQAHATAVRKGGRAGATDTVAAGTLVTIDFGDGDCESYLIGSIEESGVDDVTVVTVESPMGKALLGVRVGTEVAWQTPAGATVTATVVALATA